MLSMRCRVTLPISSMYRQDFCVYFSYACVWFPRTRVSCRLPGPTRVCTARTVEKDGNECAIGRTLTVAAVAPPTLRLTPQTHNRRESGAPQPVGRWLSHVNHLTLDRHRPIAPMWRVPSTLAPAQLTICASNKTNAYRLKLILNCDYFFKFDSWASDVSYR